MIQLFGLTLNTNKKIKNSLLNIYGLGFSSIKDILLKANINPNKKIIELSKMHLIRVRKIIENYFIIQKFVQRIIRTNILKLIRIKSRRGKRHQAMLPVHGQRTRTNARTRRGKKKTISNKNA
uniref:Ribosomal protein S13 n=1 Tax=Pteridomonas danica TaxID=38822 RepID=A0A7T1C548_9STRA|nr:ribosomal protein S13 [Pteridomonas danica]QPM99319.1 ribosomal protein S13 [Pteridomonas danica]